MVGGATKGNLVSTVITEGSKEGVSLTNQTITAEKTDFYELRIWIDESVNYSAEPDSNGLSTGVYNGYEYSLKVKVDAQNSTTESEESTSMVKNDGYNNYTINYGASDDNYFMATSTGTVNATNLQECGSGEYPGECTDVTAKAKTGIVRMTDENTSTIKANVWYKTSENNIIVYFDNGGILKITVKNDSTFSNIDIYGINKLLTLMSCVGKWCDMDSDGSISLGDVITLGTERFYVLSTDNKNNAIKMLSMYNLYVGRMYTAWNSYTEILTTDDKYGKQDASAVATPSYNKYPTYASVPFSSDEIKGTNYSDYSGSIVEGYVNNYVNFLKEEIGVKDATGMLINTDDLAAIKGDNSVLIDSIMKWAPDWLYSTSYWIEDTASNKSILNISASGGIIGNSEYRNAANFGVRPVIVISADELN